MPKCNVCNRRDAVNVGGGTCGDSYCSEYRNFASRIRNAPKGKAGNGIRAAATARMEEIDTIIRQEARYPTG